MDSKYLQRSKVCNWLRDCLKGYQTYQEKNPTYVKKNEVGEVGEVGEVVDKSNAKTY